MPSRHLVDLSIRVDHTARPNGARKIEISNQNPVPKTNPKTALVDPEPYLLEPEVAEAVNIAIALGRPLLLQGDPGCGKTRLAHAVAHFLGLPLETAYIKSTTRAQDMMYTFDAVGRLYDSQLRAGRVEHQLDPANYVHLGPFGRTIVRARFARRSVMLIDEIDKADLDFPNDLFRELDQLEFEITETNETFGVDKSRPDLRPIIFVTNNEEKALPHAFLRRCVYLELLFPEDDEFLARVLEAHDVQDADLRREVVRTALSMRGLELSRRPGISEVLDWALILQARGIDPAQVRTLPAAGALIKAPWDERLARQRLTEG